MYVIREYSSRGRKDRRGWYYFAGMQAPNPRRKRQIGPSTTWANHVDRAVRFPLRADAEAMLGVIIHHKNGTEIHDLDAGARDEPEHWPLLHKWIRTKTP